MTERSIFNRLGWFIAIYIGVWIGVQLLLTLVIDTFAPGARNKEWVFWLASMGPMYFVAFPILLVLLNRLPSRKLYKHDMSPGKLFVTYAMATAIMLIGNIIGTIITNILTNVTGLNFMVSSTDLVLEHDLIWVLLVAVIVGPIVEEVIFRKFLIDRLVLFGDVTAIVVSGLLFGFMHGNITQFFYATGLGLIFGFIYVRTGKIKYTIGLHMTANFIGGFVPAWFMQKLDFFGLEDSLLQGNFTVIFDKVGALLGFVGFELAVWGIGIAGFILLIVNRHKFVVKEGELPLTKGEVAKLFFTTPGMLIWIIATVVLFVLNVVGA